jgi:hypothetical protein
MQVRAQKMKVNLLAVDEATAFLNGDMIFARRICALQSFAN